MTGMVVEEPCKIFGTATARQTGCLQCLWGLLLSSRSNCWRIVFIQHLALPSPFSLNYALEDGFWQCMYLVTCPYQVVFLVLMVTTSSCLHNICWINAFTSSLNCFSTHEFPSRHQKHCISKDSTLFSSSASSVQFSQP